MKILGVFPERTNNKKTKYTNPQSKLIKKCSFEPQRWTFYSRCRGNGETWKRRLRNPTMDQENQQLNPEVKVISGRHRSSALHRKRDFSSFSTSPSSHIELEYRPQNIVAATSSSLNLSQCITTSAIPNVYNPKIRCLNPSLFTY